jgi:hypothetical protein
MYKDYVQSVWRTRNKLITTVVKYYRSLNVIVIYKCYRTLLTLSKL